MTSTWLARSCDLRQTLTGGSTAILMSPLSGGIDFKKFTHLQNIKLCGCRLGFSGLKVTLAQNPLATLSMSRRRHNNSLVEEINTLR